MAPSFVLAVMGVTGAGKSSFIKLTTGDERVKVGNSQESETKTIGSYDIKIRGSEFTLVDTPGFDDDKLSDYDVLKLLVEWLVRTYKSGKKLNGILYLHRITDARMRGSSLRNLNMFKELVGHDDFYKNITLGTTCWSLVSNQTALSREAELKNSSSFWKVLISKGARLERIPDDATKARELVYQIASHDPIVLQTQRDMIDFGKSFGSLAITKMVDQELEELRKKQQELARKIQRQNELEAARKEKEQREALERTREANRRAQRIQGHKNKQASCSLKKPFGRCDKPGCDNKLQHYKVTYHCCSCNSFENYWQCGPCGNNCGNDEHPYMLQIDNDDCVIM